MIICGNVAHDCRAGVGESDIRQAGLAVTKRACSIFKQRHYQPVLIVAALRGTYHMTELAGAEVIMSIAPPYQSAAGGCYLIRCRTKSGSTCPCLGML